MARFFAFLSVVAIAGGCSSAGDAVPPAADAEAGDVAEEVGGRCASARDCDDGLFCDGVEDCVEGVCVASRSYACRDLGGCGVGACDESTATCTFSVAAASCPSGEICLPVRGCVASDGCTSAGDPRCDDGRACTDDACDVATGLCVHVPDDAKCPDAGTCGRGVCLGDGAPDATGCGVEPDAARCPIDDGCDGSGACMPLASSCTRDADCDDGTLCDGRERCVSGACVHADAASCASPDRCRHALCRNRNFGEAYCEVTDIVGCD